MLIRLLAVVVLFIQTPSGAGVISGTVTDSAGHVIPGVDIAVTLDAIGPQKYRAVSNVRGEYRVEGIRSGRYRVEAALAGFETVRKENIIVDADLTALNFTMFVARRGPAPDDVFADLLSNIQRTTGPDAGDCGTFRWTREVRDASTELLQKFVGCAEKAAALHLPFRVIQQHQGVDSIVFTGFAAGSDGVVSFFDYDSAPCGSPGDCRARFSATKCATPITAKTDTGHAYLTCRN